MQRTSHNRTHRLHFASLREMSTYIAETPRVWRQHESRTTMAERSWDLSAGLDGALAMARGGWIEGAQRAQKALKAFAPATPEPDTRIDFAGYRPHVPLYCAGAPANMIRKATEAESGRGKVLTLVVSVCANSFTRASSMANFGVAVAQYVNQLERSGTRVHVIGSWVVEGSGNRLAVTWNVKRADQPLDLAVMAFSLGHPAMLRRIGFAVMERQTDCPELGAYGGARDTAATDVIGAPNGTVVLNGMKSANTHAATPEAGLAYVTEQIETSRKAQWA